jgi:hypothetical protein
MMEMTMAPVGLDDVIARSLWHPGRDDALDPPLDLGARARGEDAEAIDEQILRGQY